MSITTQQPPDERRQRWAEAIDSVGYLASHFGAVVDAAITVADEEQAENEAAIERVRETCQSVRDREGPGGMINASQILGLLSPTWPDGNYCAPPPGGEQ